MSTFVRVPVAAGCINGVAYSGTVDALAPCKENLVVEFNQILCPVDIGESSLRPLAHAAALARWYEAQLTVLHVVPTFDPMQVRSGELGAPVRILQPMTRDEVLRELRKVGEAAGLLATGVTVAAEAGQTAPVVVEQAVKIPADLVVMGTHGRSGFDRLLLGSVAEKVLRRAPCPVLTVPPHADAGAAVSFTQILCPMDFSPPALQALGFALDLARQGNGRVTLLHVLEWLSEEEPAELGRLTVEQYRLKSIADARARLKAVVADEPKIWCEVDEVVSTGKAHHEILKTAASTGSDLIVMGAQGRGGVGLTLFGSATQQVVRGAECPVLTVRGPLTVPVTG